MLVQPCEQYVPLKIQLITDDGRTYGAYHHTSVKSHIQGIARGTRDGIPSLRRPLPVQAGCQLHVPDELIHQLIHPNRLMPAELVLSSVVRHMLQSCECSRNRIIISTVLSKPVDDTGHPDLVAVRDEYLSEIIACDHLE